MAARRLSNYSSVNFGSNGSYFKPGRGLERPSYATDRSNDRVPVQVDVNQGLRMCLTTLRGIITDVRHISASLAAPETQAFTYWTTNYKVSQTAEVVGENAVWGCRDLEDAHAQRLQSQLQTLGHYVADCQERCQNHLRLLDEQLARHKEKEEQDTRLGSAANRKEAQDRVDMLRQEKMQLEESLDAYNMAIVNRSQIDFGSLTAPESYSRVEERQTELQRLDRMREDIESMNETGPVQAGALRASLLADIDRLKRIRDARLLQEYNAIGQAKDLAVSDWQAALKNFDQASKQESAAKAAANESIAKWERLVGLCCPQLSEEICLLRRLLDQGPVDGLGMGEPRASAAALLARTGLAVWHGTQLVARRV